MYRELSLAFGWTPHEIGALTLPELALYRQPVADETVRWLDAGAARQRRWERLARRNDWVRDTWEKIAHGLSAP